MLQAEAEAEAEDCMKPNKDTAAAAAAEESEEKKKKNDIELRGSGSSGMPSDCNKTNNCPTASQYDG